MSNEKTYFEVIIREVRSGIVEKGVMPFMKDKCVAEDATTLYHQKFDAVDRKAIIAAANGFGTASV